MPEQLGDYLKITAGEEKTVKRVIGEETNITDTIDVGENAVLNFIEIVNAKGKKIETSTTISCSPGSKVNFFVIIINGESVQQSRTVNLKDKAEYNELQIVSGKSKENLCLRTTVNHLGEGSRANVKAKGIMKDESSAKIPSLLHIFPSGKKSNTHSSQHFLLLSKKSRADPSPALEIEIDDVLAGHAASVSQLDSEN